MRAITAVSLFNGAGGLFMMLDELNIPIKQLYVSEVNKFANKAADLLYDKNIHLGCVTSLRRATCWKMSTLIKAFNSKYLSDKTKEELAVAMDLRGKFVDVFSAGFPCQAWSLAGKQQGDNDPRGALVHDMLKLWAYMANINPDIKFFFENVAMKKEFMTYINGLFKCDPVKINSALLTAQNRDRNYWANWPISQPEDKGIILKDILQDGPENTTLMTHKFIKRQQGRKCLVSEIKDKAVNLCAMEYVKNGRQGDYILCDEHGNQLLTRPCVLRGVKIKEGSICHHVADASDMATRFKANCRIYAGTGKSPTITTMGGGNREPKVYLGNNLYRKLTPLECMRLQGWPQWVIDILLNSGISNSQLYKMIGNGWTHPVIVHDFKCLLDTGWMQ